MAWGAMWCQISGWVWCWTLTVETAASIFIPSTSPLCTRQRASSVCCLHSGEKAEQVTGEQNFFPRESVWLTNPGCTQLPVKWPVHLGRKACPWVRGSSSAALTPSVLPSLESQGQAGAALSVAAGSSSHTRLSAPVTAGSLLMWAWGT